MSPEGLKGPHYGKEALSRVNELLDQIENPLRRFIENNGIADMLIDEHDPWDWSKKEGRLHIGGVESYQFDKDHATGDGWPIRAVHWRDKDNLYHGIEIYPELDVEVLTMLSVVSLDYNPLREERTFQESEGIDLPMPEENLTQLLQAKYDLLRLKAAKLKPR